MNQSATRNTYLIRPDLHWDKLFDGALLLRWEDKGHIVRPQSANGLLNFLNQFTGGPFELDDLLKFDALDTPLKNLVKTELLRRTDDLTGDCKMPDWYNENAISLPYPMLTFMNHGYAALPDEDLAWVRPEDLDQKYQNNLVRVLTKNACLKDKRVLDIGCGRGGAASYMARYHEASKVTGLDYCKENIDLCQRIHSMDRLDFIQGDAQDLPFESNSFDVITNIESSHCYAAPKVFFQEVYRVLREDGRFCYTDCFPVAPRYDLVDSHLTNAGFKVDISLDITQNVISAIELGKDNLAKLLREAAADAGNSDDEAEHWFKGVFRQYDLYQKGQLRYRLWNLTKR